MNLRTGFLILLLIVPAASSVRAQSPGEVVDRYMEAYNRHDVEAMLDLVGPEVQWLSIDGDRIRVETEGARALGEAMRGYFESMPSSRSEIESLIVSGNRVSVREKARWRAGDEWREQTALSVYEISEGCIVRVWYFPSE